MDVVPSAATLAAYTLAVAALAITPGPDMALFLGKTLSHSRRAGFAALLGALTGTLVHTMLVAVGLSALLAASATAFLVLKVVGAVYLLWLAVDAVRNGSAFNVAAAARSETLGAVYLKGIAINLLNPKIVMFFLTFLPQFISPTDPDAAGKLVVLGVWFAVVGAPICGVMILFAGALSRLLARSRRARRALDYIFASVLAGFAVKLITARATP
ncbi:LysE family translocator [Acuticoccus sp.]|uniref:LysE family translocator n=1 Tax=Acuticoccus sp. TaxID=1904378 RepID=UPI003B523DBC